MSTPVRFGVFEWNPEAGELRKRGVRLSVPAQSLSILAILVERPGEVVTRDEIRERLWPDGTVVEFEHSVSSAVNRLRSALDDSATTPRFVETVPRKGYRFVSPVERTASIAAAPQLTRRGAGFRLAAGAMGALLLSLLAAGWGNLPRTPPSQSVAVLPFVNLSGDAEQEYLAEGMTEELIGRLSQIEALLVVSRTSAMRFKDSRKSVPEIARELGVRAVVEGSMQKSNARVRVTAQLIDAVTDRHLWSKSYDRNMGDILTLRDEVAGAIAGELRVHLGRKPPVQVHPEAYEAFLKGRYFSARVNRIGQSKAASYFEDSVRLDPSYAPAWAGLAHAIGFLDFWNDVPASEKCLHAMRRALELDPALPEAQVNYADLKFYDDWNWQEGEAAFRRIVEQAPGSADAREHYAVCLRALGRFKAAVTEAREAARLDPLSPSATSGLGTALRASGKRDEAIRMFRRAIELDPSHGISYQLLGAALESSGKPDEALAAYLKAEELAGRSAASLAELQTVYHAGGMRAFSMQLAKKRLAELLERAPTRRISPKVLAQAYAEAGDKQHALDWLEEAHRQRCPTLTWLKVDSRWDSLRDEPRFQDVLRRMAIP
jgi:TolB-like protein/DNA-binding winged helix-turn-helix (wHTH) protein/Flp pilus assembly protein TadD